MSKKYASFSTKESHARGLLKTVLELIHLSSEYLKNKGIANPRRSAEELISDVLSLSRLDLYLNFERPLDEKELELVRSVLLRRGRGEPLAYIFEKMEFLGCQLKITPAVLIPRPETEILADFIIKDLADLNFEELSLCDLCTGSGCLGLAIKKALPKLNLTLTDISEESLKIAIANAQANGLEVSPVQGDFLTPLSGNTFDCIVSNPPYIGQKAYESLDREVREFEPKGALLAGPSGLEFYQRFAAEGALYLKPGGRVWFEIGYDQGATVFELFSKPPWKNLKIRKDWAGHDRFFSLEIE